MLSLRSGGQTGADRAALDWALENQLPHGGWCPRGRQAEDGVIADCYLLQETPSEAYEERTAWNVRDSDATVIISVGERLTGGSHYTLECANSQCRPLLHLFRRADEQGLESSSSWDGSRRAQTSPSAEPSGPRCWSCSSTPAPMRFGVRSSPLASRRSHQLRRTESCPIRPRSPPR